MDVLIFRYILIMGGPATVDGIVIACTDNFYKAEFTIDESVYVST
jgi:hypothetical protein